MVKHDLQLQLLAHTTCNLQMFGNFLFVHMSIYACLANQDVMMSVAVEYKLCTQQCFFFSQHLTMLNFTRNSPMPASSV